MKPKIAIYCGARFPKLSPQQLDQFIGQVKDLSLQLAESFDLVYGGGTIGLMGIIANQFLQSGAKVYGVIPDYLNTVEIEHTGLTDTHRVLDLHERKAKMELMADSFLVLPGGVGTADEFFEVITLKSLSRHKKPIVIWNWNHVFDGILSFLNDGVKMGFIDEKLIQQCVISDDCGVVVDNLLSTKASLR